MGLLVQMDTVGGGGGKIHRACGERVNLLATYENYHGLVHASTDPDTSAFQTDKLLRDCWWCMHLCVGVCGILIPFYTDRLVATS